jgi:glycosyltransferase involved in cell wall biosynthesis
VAQTYQNLEVILLDDGSTDDSGKIIDEYAKKYNIMKPIHQKHQGVASARQNGVAAVSGEWVSFIDPDDYVEKTFIEELLQAATKKGADIASCGLKSFSDDKDCILKESPEWPKADMTGKEMVNETMKRKYPAYLPLSIFKTELFKKSNLKFPIGREYEDVAAKIKLLFFAKKVTFLQRKLYYYRMRSNGITGKRFSESRYEDLLAAVNNIRSFINNSGCAEEFSYMNYYDFCTRLTLLNYLAREKKFDKKMKGYWSDIRRSLKKLFKKAKFPSFKLKVLNLAFLVLSSNRRIYSAMYMKAKAV